MKTRKRSRLLAGLLVLVMVVTLMPTAASAAEHATNAVTATKVTAEPADWSGEYLLVYED